MDKFYVGELYHFGILGQKWGIRRYQNKDGSLTEKGKKRYTDNNGNIDLVKMQRDRNISKYTKIGLAVLATYGGIRLYNKMFPKTIEKTKKVVDKILKGTKQVKVKEHIRNIPKYEKIEKIITETVKNPNRKFLNNPLFS